LAADDGSPFLSDDDDTVINSRSRAFNVRLVPTGDNSSASSCPFDIRLVSVDEKLHHITHIANPVSEPSAASGLATVKAVLAASGSDVTRCGETASILAGMNLFIYSFIHLFFIIYNKLRFQPAMMRMI